MYLIERREWTVSARVTGAHRKLLEAAAAARGAQSLSAYIAEVATEAARRDLVGQSVSDRSTPVDPRPVDENDL
jgi:uncharacterized protein (DUF1778 family)